MKTRASQLLGNHQLCTVAFIAAMALLLVPAGASAAASPVLEFVVPGHSLSEVSFTTVGGELSAQMAGFEVLVHCTARGKSRDRAPPFLNISSQGAPQFGGSPKCKSEGANAEEITTGPIVGDLVWIDQTKDEVGILMNPSSGTYISFECGGESAEGKGPFLAPVSPLNQETTSFTATLTQSNSVQTPDQYEGEKGEPLYAFPTGKRGSKSFVPTGVESTFTIHSNLLGEIKAITAQEIEAKQREEEAKKQEEARQKQEAALKKQEEALKKVEEHAKQAGEEAKKHEAELNAQIAAIKKHQEEEAARKKQEESKPPTRAQLLKKALKKCQKDKPKSKRMRCERAVEKKYGATTKKGHKK